MSQSNELTTFTQYGAVGYEIVTKYMRFRDSYIKYFKHKAKTTLNQNHKLELIECAFDLYLLLEGAILKYKFEKEKDEKDMIGKLNDLKWHMDKFNTDSAIPTSQDFNYIKDIYAEFLMMIGVMDIFFKSKKKKSPEQALLDMDE